MYATTEPDIFYKVNFREIKVIVSSKFRARAQDLDDLTQDCFLYFFSKKLLDKYRPGSDFASFVYSCITNWACNVYRKSDAWTRTVAQGQAHVDSTSASLEDSVLMEIDDFHKFLCRIDDVQVRKSMLSIFYGIKDRWDGRTKTFSLSSLPWKTQYLYKAYVKQYRTYRA